MRARPDTVGASRDGATRWQLSPQQLCDLELLSTGAFAPVTTYQGRADYESVCQRLRTAAGELWPIPIVLDLPETALRRSGTTPVIHLLEPGGRLLARLEVEEAWKPDRLGEAECVVGTTDAAHPWVSHLQERTHDWYVAGRLTMLRRPRRPGLPPIQSPAEVRRELAGRGWDRVVAFNTRNPMHGAHRALALHAARSIGASLLLHPVVGPTRPGDLPPVIRARCHLALLATMPPESTMLAFLPLAMRMAGPREALWHALIRRNYGATAFIVGRDHAGPGVDSRGKPFYGLYDAQRLVAAHVREMGITMVPGRELVYAPGLGYVSEAEVPAGRSFRRVSGSLVRQLLSEGRDIPAWLVPPEVVSALRGSV
jgi:sulfate adenylyltransferase